ncbi:MAG: branched-chain amino acid ABC transporter permease [Janthinobacterium lividum]
MISQALMQATLSGVVTGCIYALVALSIVIIYKSSGVVNFAGGDFLMVGAFLALPLVAGAGLPYWIVFPLVALGTALLGALFESTAVVTILKHSRRRDSALVPIVIATFGLSYILRGLARVTPYADDVQRLPAMVSGPPLLLGNVIVLRQDLVIIAVTMVLIVVFWLFFGTTLLGKALQATSQNTRAAMLVGIPVRRMRMVVWAMSGAIAGIAGILLGPKLLVTPDMGGIIMLALASAVIGGFSNLPGAVSGGILVGIVQNLVGFYAGSWLIELAPFLIIMLVLATRPQGLFSRGAAAVKKV